MPLPLPGQTPGRSTCAAIALGANLGDREASIRFAFDRLALLPHSSLLAASAIIETDPVGPILQNPYLNAAALLQTHLPPRDLLNHLFEIEQLRGRQRSVEERWGPRTLDLDLLLYGDCTLDEPGLIIPHPRLHERPFVLIPLAEIAAEMRVPAGGRGRTISELLAALAPPSPSARAETQ